jgi:hypothetical protein
MVDSLRAVTPRNARRTDTDAVCGQVAGVLEDEE